MSNQCYLFESEQYKQFSYIGFLIYFFKKGWILIEVVLFICMNFLVLWKSHLIYHKYIAIFSYSFQFVSNVINMPTRMFMTAQIMLPSHFCTTYIYLNLYSTKSILSTLQTDKEYTHFRFIFFLFLNLFQSNCLND